MQLIAYIIAFLLMFAGSANAVDVSSCGVLSSSYTSYTLTQDVESNGSCFVLTAPGITLDLGGHTITYDNAARPTVTNGDFESTGGWNLPANASFATGTFVNPVAVHSGSKSLKFTVPAPDQYALSNPVALQPNTTYALTALVRSPYSLTLGNILSDYSNTTMYVELLNPTGVTGTFRSQLVGPSYRGFQYLRAEFTTGASPTSVTIKAGISGASSGAASAVFFDDIRIQRTRLAGVVVGPESWHGVTKQISDVTQYGIARFATIFNGTIQQGQGKAEKSSAIYIPDNSSMGDDTTKNGFSIHDLTLRVDGADSHAVNISYGSYGQIYNLNVYNPQWFSSDRDHYSGAAIFSYGKTYGRKIFNNTVHEAVQTAIELETDPIKTPKPEIYGNNLTIQSYYTNDFAISAASAIVHDNIVNCGSGDNSCRGIVIGGTGTLVYNNTVSVQQLPRSQEYNGCELYGAYGMQMEYATNGVNVYNNTVTANAGTCQAHALRLNPRNVETTASSANNNIHENIFTAVKNGTAIASSLKLSSIYAEDASIVSNTFKTNDRWIWHDGEVGDVVNPTFTNNKWETAGTLSDPFYPFLITGYTFTAEFTGNFYGTDDQARFEDSVFRTPSNAVAAGSTFTTTQGTPPVPSCFDAIQNGDETGVDCGGSCLTQCYVPPSSYSDHSHFKGGRFKGGRFR